MLTKIDEVSTTVTYMGFSVSGNSTADPVWKIYRFTISGADLDIDSPLGVLSKNAIWDDRTTYSYG